MCLGITGAGLAVRGQVTPGKLESSSGRRQQRFHRPAPAPPQPPQVGPACSAVWEPQTQAAVKPVRARGQPTCLQGCEREARAEACPQPARSLLWAPCPRARGSPGGRSLEGPRRPPTQGEGGARRTAGWLAPCPSLGTAQLWVLPSHSGRVPLLHQPHAGPRALSRARELAVLLSSRSCAPAAPPAQGPPAAPARRQTDVAGSSQGATPGPPVRPAAVLGSLPVDVHPGTGLPQATRTNARRRCLSVSSQTVNNATPQKIPVQPPGPRESHPKRSVHSLLGAHDRAGH